MPKFSEAKLKKVIKGIDWSNKQLQYGRNKRISAIKEMLGYHYSANGCEHRNPVNTLALAVMIHVRLLAAKTPRVLITSRYKELAPTAANLELALNQIPEEINLDSTFRRLVMEALFAVGIAKVGLHTVGNVLGHSYGQPFVDIVTLDDYFCDMAARSWETLDYEGNDYWSDYDEVMEYDWNAGSTNGLKPDEYNITNENGEKKAESISNNGSVETYADKILLRDVWLPSEGLLITYAVKSEKILHEIEWDGPKFGPYHKLGYTDVPGNLLPLSSVSLWRDLHELGNDLFRKIAEGASRKKTVLGFDGSDDAGVEAFKMAKNGDGIKWGGRNPEKLEAGGIDASTLAFYLQTRDLSSYFANNLDSLGGLAAMAQTVGQEKLIGEAAGANLRDMGDKTTLCIKNIFKALAHYEWTDPVRKRTLNKPIPGIDETIPVEWNKESKKGKFEDYNFDIDVYSRQDNSPQIKLQKLDYFVEKFAKPLEPMITQNGGTIDVEKIIKEAAKCLLPPDLQDIVIFPEQMDQAGGDTQTPSMPSETKRTYERIGRPGQTKQGATAMMTQLLMGGNPGGENTSQ